MTNGNKKNKQKSVISHIICWQNNRKISSFHPFSATYPGSGCKGSRLIYAYMSRPHSALAKPTNQPTDVMSRLAQDFLLCLEHLIQETSSRHPGEILKLPHLALFRAEEQQLSAKPLPNDQGPHITSKAEPRHSFEKDNF